MPRKHLLTSLFINESVLSYIMARLRFVRQSVNAKFNYVVQKWQETHVVKHNKWNAKYDDKMT